MSLRTGENVLLFPSSHPKVDVSPLAHLKPRPGQIIAVMDPPRDQTQGGVLLQARGDGWTDPNTLAIKAAEDEFERAYRVWHDVRLRQDQDPLSLSLKRQAEVTFEVAKSACEHLAEVEQRRNPGAALDLRPDAATVAAVGEGVPLIPGDRLMVAPYAAWRFKSMLGVPDVLVIGADDPWEEICPFVWNPTCSAWELTANWLVLDMQQDHSKLTTTILNSARVLMAGPNAEARPGELVATNADRTVQRPDNTKWFISKFGGIDGKVIVREQDHRGVQRILGKLETTIP